MKRCYLVSALCGVALSAMTVSTARGADKAPGEKRELLAVHETLAVFDGVEYQLCRGMTALCPDKCGNSGEFANFAVKKYLKYKKNGEYGDPEQQSFQVQISDFDKKPLGDPKILQTVKGLKKGDYVLLSWNHDYVTKEGTSSPERPLVKLEKIEKAKAEALLKAGAQAPATEDHTKGFMPIVPLAAVVSAEAEVKPDAKVAAIKELTNLEPKENAFKGGRPPQPTVLHSEKEASEYFAADVLAKLKKQVDFNQQVVLLFAWQGSGQDKLTSAVAESYPEQVSFAYQPGRTRDLRPHVHVYALRSNVKWSAK
jgi:hypothetical protein